MVIMRMKILKLSDMYIQQLERLWDLVGPLLQLTYSMKTRYVAISLLNLTLFKNLILKLS